MPNLKNYIIFNFDTNVDKDQVLNVLSEHVEGKIKCNINSVFVVTSIQSNKCIDEITMILEQANWEFMIFDMEASRGQIPHAIKNLFFDFTSAQPFLKTEKLNDAANNAISEATLKNLGQDKIYNGKNQDLPKKDDLSWTANGPGRTPQQRMDVLAFRRKTYKKMLNEALEYEKYEMAALYRDYITLLTNTMIDIEIEIQLQNTLQEITK